MPLWDKFGTSGRDRKSSKKSQELPKKKKVQDALDPVKKADRNNQKASANPKKSNWQKLSERTFSDRMDTRDIQGTQQLDRSELGDVRGELGPNILAIIAGLMAGLVSFLVLGLGTFLIALLLDFQGGTQNGESQGLTPEQIEEEYGIAPYYVWSTKPYGAGYVDVDCIFEVGPDGQQLTTDPDYCYTNAGVLPVPTWYTDKVNEAMGVSAEEAAANNEGQASSKPSWFSHLITPSWWKILLSMVIGVTVWGVSRTVFMRQLAAENQMTDVTDINQHMSDQHIQLPQEMVNRYSAFPDVGAHASTQVSSMLGHAMLLNKGIKKVVMPERAENDILDEDGEIIVHAGDILRDDEDVPIMGEAVPMFDTEFSHALFEASGVVNDKRLRRFFDATRIEHNPEGKNLEITGSEALLSEHINNDWVLPEYEPQRPAGIYIVDEAPVNTMVLAMTRAGKGQTYIEPVLDMWTRERKPNNMVINDPKAELLVNNFVRLTVRGYQVVQFNLINALKTDIYNPLGMAAESAREGDFTKCATYVENIAEVFFPVDGSDDPVWPNAANNAFKRTAYGLIDFYLEEEREMRSRAVLEGWDQKVLDTRIDKMWGNVTLFNCYLFFVQLSAKKLPNPEADIAKKVQEGKLDEMAANAQMDAASERVKLWEGQDEIDTLTLFFNATDALPNNGMRDLVSNADKALRAMAGAEKMLASVYGIAITAMSFFTDPTISTLTSGTLSQNTDLGSLSFPRRFGVRFAQNYMAHYHLVGARVKWDCFKDSSFTEQIKGEDFTHEDTLSREGWARAYFKGIFESDVSYLRLRIMHSSTGNLMRTFYFKFTKAYQTDLRGRQYIEDPVTEQKIVKNGVLVEMKPTKNKHGKRVFATGTTLFKRKQLSLATMTSEELQNIDADKITMTMGAEPAIMSSSVRYAEQPKAVFLVTPPHLMKYAKIILILLKQLVDLNFDKSYMTKSNQKPLYKTRFMLDELGNLQSEGHGIAGFETMLSIGLGQSQQFTLILQTLQQLRDVYGESVDKIVQGNTSNIVFLKSTDDSMIETLSKMSGTTHRVYRDSKTVTRDVEKLFLQTEGKVSYTSTAKEEAVISYNDLAYLPPRNSVVFRAGDAPIWNRNETILPMSWRLFKNSIQHFGHEDYTLQTIPTLSTAIDFDVRQNQPNFAEMLEKRLTQAAKAGRAADIYAKAYDLDAFTVERLDPDVYAEEVLDIVRKIVQQESGEHQGLDTDVPESFDETVDMVDDTEIGRPQEAPNLYEAQDAAVREGGKKLMESMIDNEEFQRAQNMVDRQHQEDKVRRYADGRISREMLYDRASQQLIRGAYDQELVMAFNNVRQFLADDPAFSVRNDELYSANGEIPYITRRNEGDDIDKIREAAQDSETQVYAEDEAFDEMNLSESNIYTVHDEFKRQLIRWDHWKDLAGGRFDDEVARAVKLVESRSGSSSDHAGTEYAPVGG